MVIRYAAFQRGAPREVKSGDQIAVSVTIVNDLRDAVYTPSRDDEDAAVTIQLAWINETQQDWSLIAYAGKIHWDGPSSAYSVCQAKVPSRAAVGGDAATATIRLAIWVTSTDQCPDGELDQKLHKSPPWVYTLVTERAPSVAFVPAVSPSIRLAKVTSSDKVSGNSRLIRVTPDDVALEIREESGYELDKHIWDASHHLATYMHRNADVLFEKLTGYSTSPTKEIKPTIVELGAGTGLVSLIVGQMLQRIDRQAGADQYSIEATDLASAIPALYDIVKLNEPRFDDNVVCINCSALDWTEPPRLAGCDLVLVSDCTYNPTYFAPLFATIRSLLRQGGGRAGAATSRCLLAKKHRHGDEAGMWEHCDKAGLQYTLVDGSADIDSDAETWGIWSLTCR